MLVDAKGVITHPRIHVAIYPGIERGEMPVVRGIIVHQTDSSTAQSSFNSYGNPKANGAHFLIDKDGTVYQTASVFKKTNHVGKLRSRCLAEMNCAPAEMRIARKWDAGGTHKRELAKVVPGRYPSNDDAIGIELVGKSFPGVSEKDPRVFEAVTTEQNQALKWLVGELRELMKVPLTEIYRHPIVSHKTPSEAQTASW